MVNIDTVYQKVLAIANKEQRGYITPQEFNLLADKAQNEIFDNYFHDIKTAYHKPKNQMGVAYDDIELLQEKLQPFKHTASINQSAGDATVILSTQFFIYLIDNIFSAGVEVVELSQKEILYTQNNPLTQATTNRIVYVREEPTIIRLYPTPTEIITLDIHYWRRPSINNSGFLSPHWGYVVVNGQALHNTSTMAGGQPSAGLTTHFHLHASEEENLVSRILQLAGVVIKQQDVQQAGFADKQIATQEKNN